ncbi:TPA: esterase family protein [Listeria monocytogenes]|nr:esterase family protein [Listeria monocytogenes]
MAILELNFKSVCLAMQTSVTVILPETDALYHGSIPKYKTLYILHGLSNNHTTYVRNTNIERYATEKGLAVVMPAADHSFYSNMIHGRDFFEFVSTELPHVMKNWFPLSDKKEDTFIAGHSMGGYGAFKVALTFPEKFQAAASMSGVMDINYIIKEDCFENFSTRAITGEMASQTGTENDLFHLLETNLQNQVPLPALFQNCGTEDFLYEDNLRFRDFALEKNAPLEYREGPGDHDWDFWDKSIKEIIDWLPL